MAFAAAAGDACTYAFECSIGLACLEDQCAPRGSTDAPCHSDGDCLDGLFCRGGFVNGAKALVNPALVMVAAVAPLALIAGGLVLLFGGRRGMQIIGTSLGVLLLLGSVTALIN